MVPEASLIQTEEGLEPKGAGWYVINAREGRWRRRDGRGFVLPFTGWEDEECETLFTQLGVNLCVLGPGEPIGIYHREKDAEGFLVLAGEPLLLIEGKERRLRPWDYVHMPPGTEHMALGAGDTPCVVLAIGSRQFMATPEWGMYVADPLAARHGCGVDEDTPDAGVAYARYGPSEPTTYQGWLPD